jgi:hypothetical protein
MEAHPDSLIPLSRACSAEELCATAKDWCCELSLVKELGSLL